MPNNSLKRILGLGFGIAVIFGGTVGVGILRLPGVIAGQLGSSWLIMLVWLAGGCYAMLGAASLAELGTALPQAGGFYVYSKRAFGLLVGFGVGWADWLNNCATLAFAPVAAAEYIAALVPALSSQKLIALGILASFCALHWAGLRLSSSIQRVTSSVTAFTFVALAIACLAHPVHPGSMAAPRIGMARGGGFLPMLVLLVAAIRAIVVTYDGWYEAIYFTEEDTDASKHLPKAMMGGVVLVLGLYLLMNLAFLHVLSIPALAGSNLPAADAARVVFPQWSGTFVTVLSLLTLLSLINAVLLGAPRILLAIGRDGLLTARAAQVDSNGTPRAALLFSASAAAFLIATGRFEDTVAVSAILIAGTYTLNYVAVLVLRWREPSLPRPYRAWGYPVSTLVVLLASFSLLIATVHDEPREAWRAAALLAVAIPAYAWMKGRKHAA
jgi:APA family basic amino acid/polyamine antiporter